MFKDNLQKQALSLCVKPMDILCIHRSIKLSRSWIAIKYFRLRIIMLITLLISSTSFLCTLKAQESEKSNTTTTSLVIRGTIKNLSEVVALANSKSFIQLVPISEDGIIWTTFQFAEGSLSSIQYNSNLATQPLPKQANFTFKCDSLASGKYFLAVQGLKINWSKVEEGPMLLTDQGDSYIINVPSNAGPIIEINAGPLAVRIKR
jgi:hypothetical protein